MKHPRPRLFHKTMWTLVNGNDVTYWPTRGLAEAFLIGKVGAFILDPIGE